MGEIRTIPLRSMPMGMSGVIPGAPPRAQLGNLIPLAVTDPKKVTSLTRSGLARRNDRGKLI